MASPATRPHDQRTAKGDAIVAELREAALPLHPHGFELWSAYRAGHHPMLNVAIDEIRAEGPLTAVDLDRLHEEHLSPWRLGGGRDVVIDGLAAQLRALTAAIEGAVGAVHEHGEVLLAEACGLSVTESLTLRNVVETVDRLMRAARDERTRTALLEARLMSASRQISALQKQLSAVREDARRDPLTSACNPAGLHLRLGREVAEFATVGTPLALALCDVDYLEHLNESFGTVTGDAVLRTVAMVLKTQARVGDTVARLEDDTFAIVLPNASVGEAVALCEIFRQTLMAYGLVTRGTRSARVTISVGVAEAVADDTTDTLLERARAALRVAKSEGRNRVVQMTPEGPIWVAKRRA
jgi:diguanylate cyclase (GGDEF)-like protein